MMLVWKRDANFFGGVRNENRDLLQNVTTNLVGINGTHPVYLGIPFRRRDAAHLFSWRNPRTILACELLLAWSPSANFRKVDSRRQQWKRRISRAGRNSGSANDVQSEYQFSTWWNICGRRDRGSTKCGWCLRDRWTRAVGEKCEIRMDETWRLKRDERHVECPRWRRPCYYGRTRRYVRRKRSKQLVSGPYHEVLSAPLTTATSRLHRGLASRNRCRRRHRGCRLGQETQGITVFLCAVGWSAVRLLSQSRRRAIVMHNCTIFIQAMRDCI